MSKIITVGKNGLVQLPEWVVKAIIKEAGLRSKKKRIIKKVLKREFQQMIRDAVREVEAEGS